MASITGLGARGIAVMSLDPVASELTRLRVAVQQQGRAAAAAAAAVIEKGNKLPP